MVHIGVIGSCSFPYCSRVSCSCSSLNIVEADFTSPVSRQISTHVTLEPRKEAVFFFFAPLTRISMAPLNLDVVRWLLLMRLDFVATSQLVDLRRCMPLL